LATTCHPNLHLFVDKISRRFLQLIFNPTYLDNIFLFRGDNLLTITRKFEFKKTFFLLQTLILLTLILCIPNVNAPTPLGSDGTSFLYDFGTATSPLEPGYIRISHYKSVDRGAPDDLRRDFIFDSSDATFVPWGIPNGDYRITVIIGDNDAGHDLIDVFVEGVLRIDDLTVSAGEFAVKTFRVTLSDGELNIRFHDDGGSDPDWLVNAVMIMPFEICNLVVRGSNNIIYYRQYDCDSESWGGWTALPGSTPDTPAAAVCDNELHIVVRGMDGNSLYHGYVDLLTDSFSGWSLVGGATPSEPTLVCWENGERLVLVVRGNDNRIYHRHYDLVTESWYAWSTLIPGSTPDSPAAAVDGDYLNLVVRGMDDNLYSMKFSLIIPVMPGWTNIGGTTPSVPTLTSNYKESGDDHEVYLVVRGSDNGIYLRSYDGSWSSWSKLPGSTNDAVGACIMPLLPDPEANLHIVVRGTNGAMYHGKYDLNSESFLGWSWMSGSTPSPPKLTS
jgi:hypothetical protein